MTMVTIEAADAVYASSAACQMSRSLVDHPELQALYRSVTRLVRELGDCAADEFWRRIMWRITRYADAWRASSWSATAAAHCSATSRRAR
jgi:hypothetical protein